MRDSINNVVHKCREKSGITQEELAGVVGVTRQTIIAIEKGNYVPSLLLAFKIAKFFNQSIEKIFSYEK